MKLPQVSATNRNDQQAFDPAQASRTLREYLEGIEAEGRPETQRKSISATDPAAEWTCAPGGPAFFAYSTNYLVDMRYGVIGDVEATSAHRPKDVHAMRTMIERVEHSFAIKQLRLIGDMAYGKAESLAWDRTQRTDDTLSSSGFRWDEERNEYRCPQEAGGFALTGAHLRTHAAALSKPIRFFTSPGKADSRVVR